MEKRLYIKPKTLINDIILQSVIAGSLETGIIETGLAKEREEDELDIENESEKVNTEYSLW